MSYSVDSLIHDIGALKPGRGHNVCVAGAMLAALDPRALNAVETALADRRIPATRVCEVLEKHGVQVHEAGLRRHRRRGTPGGCSCPADQP